MATEGLSHRLALGVHDSKKLGSGNWVEAHQTLRYPHNVDIKALAHLAPANDFSVDCRPATANLIARSGYRGHTK